MGISLGSMRQKLKNAGASQTQAMRLMRRAIIDNLPMKQKNAFLRVRYEGNKVAERLGFEWQEAVFGDVMAAYRAQYPNLKQTDTVGNIQNVRFSDPLPLL